MPNVFIDSKKYAIYVRVLGGEGDGPLIYVDARGLVHVVGGGGDPTRLEGPLAAGLKEIEAGANTIQQVVVRAAQHG